MPRSTRRRSRWPASTATRSSGSRATSRGTPGCTRERNRTSEFNCRSLLCKNPTFADCCQVRGVPVEVLFVLPPERAPDDPHGEDASLVPLLRGRLPPLDHDEEALRALRRELRRARRDADSRSGGAWNGGRCKAAIRDTSSLCRSINVFILNAN